MSEQLPLSEQILSRLKAYNDYVSFVELSRWFPEYFDGGDRVIELQPNLCIWYGVTEAGAAALKELFYAKRLIFYPASLLVYLVDGAFPQLPLAKKYRAYAKPHWLPVTLRLPERLAPREQQMIAKARRKRGEKEAINQ